MNYGWITTNLLCDGWWAIVFDWLICFCFPCSFRWRTVQLCGSDFGPARNDGQTAGTGDWLQDHGARPRFHARQEKGMKKTAPPLQPPSPLTPSPLTPSPLTPSPLTPSLPHSLTPFNQQYCSINLPIALERAFRDRSAAPDRFQIGSWAALCHKRLNIGSLVWLLATRGSCLYSIKINWNPWTYYNIQRIQSILSFHQHQFPIIFNSICRNEWLNCCRQDFWFNSMKRSTICHSFNSHSNKNKLMRAIFERIEPPRWRAVWFQAAGDRSGPIGMLTKLNAATVSLSLVYDSPLATNERTGGAEPR